LIDAVGRVGLLPLNNERKERLMKSIVNNSAFGYGQEFYARESWRFIIVQQEVVKLAQTAVDFPPVQAPASFNLDAIKRQFQKMMKAHEAQ
jgi:hypothetical protein